jgi:hypothetical protein
MCREQRLRVQCGSAKAWRAGDNGALCRVVSLRKQRVESRGRAGQAPNAESGWATAERLLELRSEMRRGDSMLRRLEYVVRALAVDGGMSG